ncbi:MAG: sigma-70 family RNA polymerase sigma factor [Caldilineaceae bacterium]
MNESVLIQRSLAGEIEPFNQLVLHYQGLAFSVAYRMLQDADAAADAVQDSFIKAFRALHTFQGGNFKAWLLRIVTNTCYDVLRSRQRRAAESLDNLPVEQEYAQQMLDASESPEQHAERMELNRAIERGIQSLPPDQRLVLILCDVHGYAYEEIAEITQMPIGTVKSRISRGRAKLRNHLYRQPELLPTAFRPTEEVE